MTTQIGASVFVDPSQIRHNITNGNPTITFGPWPTVNRVDVHLGDVATIDKVIAALVALKQEMDPPVVGCDCMADAPAPSGIWAAQDFTPGDGGVLLPAGCDPDAPRILDVKVPAPAGTWCTASTVRDGITVYCDVKGPHDDHRGPGRDECCEVVWSDAPQAVTA